MADSRAKHYVSVRQQQGVPIVDADVNETEDLRRLEFEDLNRVVTGDGVPLGNDGFRILAIEGGGVGTIVLRSKKTAVGQSSVKINLASSSAAAALGFTASNALATRFGSSPAQLTGNKAQPFQLANGQTLVVEADGQPSQTVTFTAAGFANMAAATAAEVVAAINAAISNVAASPGTGNDFIIRGGDGTAENAGRILVGGQMVLNNADLKYSEQPLFKNTELASRWGVGVVPALATPSATEPYTVFLDVWHREVDSNEDRELIDNRIGVETAIRVRREWAVRVAKTVDFPGLVANRPAGHAFYALAVLSRVTNVASLEAQRISDERDIDLALRREVIFRALDGAVLVNSAQLLTRFIETRDSVRDFIQFLTIKFVQPGLSYLAGEVIGIQSLSAIATLADYGTALMNTKSLDSKGALALFGQLLEAENRFVSVWETAVLPLVKAGGQVYSSAYKDVIARIKTFLVGPAPIGFISLTSALQQKNLFEAVRTQGQINASFSSEINRPIGTLLLTYLGSATPTILKNQPFDLRYKVTGSVSPRDDLDVEVFTVPTWQSTVKNSDGTIPFTAQFGPGNDSRELIVTLLPPNLDNAASQINLRVSARHNNSGLTHSSTPKALAVGSPPPLSEQDFAINVATANVNLVGNAFQVPISLASADIKFRVFNNTNAPVPVTLDFNPKNSPPWNIVKDIFPLDGSIGALGHRDCLFQFGPPNTVGQSLTFTFLAKHATTSQLLGQVQITLVTVSG
ncbi:MAG TPA: hypothetical protein VJ464_12080 [Blastocatellia bacterium]|nr:hypothetical protein [Blastocatellia bacterium]